MTDICVLAVVCSKPRGRPQSRKIESGRLPEFQLSYCAMLLGATLDSQRCAILDRYPRRLLARDENVPCTMRGEHTVAWRTARRVAPRRAAVWRAAWTCMALAQIVAPACTLGLGARLATGLAACWCDKWRGVCGAALTPSLHCVSTILHTSIVLHTDLSHIARARGQSTAQAHRDHVSDHGTWMCMIVDT